MITPTPLAAQPDPWQRELAAAITDPERLLEALRLPTTLLPAARAAAERFSLRVTRHYLGLIRPGEPDDPLLRQVLPLAEELESVPGFVSDPVGDGGARVGHGILQKYHGRALLVLTGACAIHCRYCFRRHFPYDQDNAIRHHGEMLERLRSMTDIEEVILSGGDPLSLSDHRLEDLLDSLETISHLKRLRFHTRLPVVLPERITSRLTQRLAAGRLATSLVLHVNHPRELTPALGLALRPLRENGITLLNQSVLLRGVNDDEDTLCNLSTGLFEHGILPYYLHLLDPVEAAAHFALPEERALALHRAMRSRLPGYLLPRMVREVEGEAAKRPVIG